MKDKGHTPKPNAVRPAVRKVNPHKGKNEQRTSPATITTADCEGWILLANCLGSNATPVLMRGGRRDPQGTPRHDQGHSPPRAAAISKSGYSMVIECAKACRPHVLCVDTGLSEAAINGGREGEGGKQGATDERDSNKTANQATEGSG